MNNLYIIEGFNNNRYYDQDLLNLVKMETHLL
jgi:hypothetical protein